MTRYKSRQSLKAVEKHFPHFVDAVVPPGGLGKRLDAMYEFHTRQGIKRNAGMVGTMLTALSFAGVLLIRLWLKRSR